MKTIGNTIGIILKRPTIIIFWGIVTLIFTLGSYFIPIFKTIYEISTISGSNTLDSLMSFIQMFYGYLSDYKIVIIVLVLLLVIIAALSIVSGALLSGYFYILNITINRQKRTKKDFIVGFRKHFGPVWIVTFVISLAGFFLGIFMSVASVPTLVIIRASIEKGKHMLPALLFVVALTGVVLFFGFMFFRIYTLFWYPALINNEKKALLKAKRFADANFWKILNTIFVFDIVFAGYQIASIKIGNGLAFLPLKWMFLTAFYTLFTTYIFTAYSKYPKKTE